MTTIKTMMFQMGEGGFTMTTMQVFSRFMNAFLIARHEIQMAMNLQFWPQMTTMLREELTIVINDDDNDKDNDNDVNKEL